MLRMWYNWNFITNIITFGKSSCVIVGSFRILVVNSDVDFLSKYFFNSSSWDINSKVCTNGPNKSTLKKYIFVILQHVNYF